MKAHCVLLTGFGPFGSLRVNPSVRAAAQISGRLGDAWAVELPTEYVGGRQRLECALEAAPDVLVMFGYSARTDGLKIERLAFNPSVSPAPDNVGTVGRDMPPVWPGVDELESTVDTTRLAERFRDAPVAVTVSTDPGGYVCNYVYFSALAWSRRRTPATRTVFVHIGNDSRDVVETATEVVREIRDHAVNVASAGPPDRTA